MPTKLQTEIRKFLKPLCKWVFVTTAGSLPGTHYRLSPKGFPDIMAMTKRGKIMFIEVKGSRDKERQHQLDFIQWHAERGHFSIVARSINDVENLMRLKGWIV